MASVGDFTSYLLGSLKDEESAQVALYHYLKNFYHDESSLTPELMNRFFEESLHLPHWQAKKNQLFIDVTESLSRFFKMERFESPTGSAPFNFKELLDLVKMQFIFIHQPSSLHSVVMNHERASLKEGESLRVLLQNDTHALAIKRFQNADVVVRTYNNFAKISGHLVLPLAPLEELHYDSHLELRSNATQILRTAPHSQVRFQIKDEVVARFISGFAFRLSQEITTKSVANEARIFYPLKRLERYYVDRNSDPFYSDLVVSLERAISNTTSEQNPLSGQNHSVFENGQIIFDQIYPDDKTLYLKLRELAKLRSNQKSKGSAIHVAK
jgi:hypothetical protein